MTPTHYFLLGTLFGILVAWPLYLAVQWWVCYKRESETVQLGEPYRDDLYKNVGFEPLSDDEWDKWLRSIHEQGGSHAGAQPKEERIDRHQ